jgi:hypothetical protein
LNVARPAGFVLIARAKKSACFGVNGVCVWVRITSSIGTTGAACSKAKPTPRISSPCSSSENTKVAVSRWSSPIRGLGSNGGGGAGMALMGQEITTLENGVSKQ